MAAVEEEVLLTSFVRGVPGLQWVSKTEDFVETSIDVARFVLEGCEDYEDAVAAITGEAPPRTFLLRLREGDARAHVELVAGLRSLVKLHVEDIRVPPAYRRAVRACLDGQLLPVPRSVLLSELVALVVHAEGTPAGRAEIRSVSGRLDLVGTERSAATSAAAFANTKRALERLRRSPRVDRLMACVPASAVARGDPDAVRQALAAIARALPDHRHRAAADGLASSRKKLVGREIPGLRERRVFHGDDDDDEGGASSSPECRRLRRRQSDEQRPPVERKRSPSEEEQQRRRNGEQKSDGQRPVERKHVPLEELQQRRRRHNGVQRQMSGDQRPIERPSDGHQRRRNGEQKSDGQRPVERKHVPSAEQQRRRRHNGVQRQMSGDQRPIERPSDGHQRRHHGEQRSDGQRPVERKHVPSAEQQRRHYGEARQQSRQHRPPVERERSPSAEQQRRHHGEQRSGEQRPVDRKRSPSAEQQRRHYGEARQQSRQHRPPVERERSPSEKQGQQKSETARPEPQEKVVSFRDASEESDRRPPPDPLSEDEGEPCSVQEVSSGSVELRAWLAAAGLSVPAAAGLRDPVANGALACELAVRCGGRHELLSRGASGRPPSSWGSASRRTRAALAVLGTDSTDFWEIVASLRGSRELGAALETGRPCAWRLPYSPQDRAAVAAALAAWLNAANLWELDFTDGTLLCSLAARLSRARVGALRPTTRALKLANISRALGVLRDWHVKLGWRHANCERRILIGDWGGIFPLLDDCYRVAHGQPPEAPRDHRSRVKPFLPRPPRPDVDCRHGPRLRMPPPVPTWAKPPPQTWATALDVVDDIVPGARRRPPPPVPDHQPPPVPDHQPPPVPDHQPPPVPDHQPPPVPDHQPPPVPDHQPPPLPVTEDVPDLFPRWSAAPFVVSPDA